MSTDSRSSRSSSRPRAYSRSSRSSSRPRTPLRDLSGSESGSGSESHRRHGSHSRSQSYSHPPKPKSRGKRRKKRAYDPNIAKNDLRKEPPDFVLAIGGFLDKVCGHEATCGLEGNCNSEGGKEEDSYDNRHDEESVPESVTTKSSGTKERGEKKYSIPESVTATTPSITGSKKWWMHCKCNADSSLCGTSDSSFNPSTLETKKREHSLGRCPTDFTDESGIIEVGINMSTKDVRIEIDPHLEFDLMREQKKVLDEIQAASQESSKEADTKSKDSDQEMTNVDANMPNVASKEKRMSDPPVTNDTKQSQTKIDNDKKLKKKQNEISNTKDATKDRDNLSQKSSGSKSHSHAADKKGRGEKVGERSSNDEPAIVSSKDDGMAASSKDDGIAASSKDAASKDDGIVAEENDQNDKEDLEEEKFTIVDHMLVCYECTKLDFGEDEEMSPGKEQIADNDGKEQEVDEKDNKVESSMEQEDGHLAWLACWRNRESVLDSSDKALPVKEGTHKKGDPADEVEKKQGASTDEAENETSKKDEGIFSMCSKHRSVLDTLIYLKNLNVADETLPAKGEPQDKDTEEKEPTKVAVTNEDEDKKKNCMETEGEERGGQDTIEQNASADKQKRLDRASATNEPNPINVPFTLEEKDQQEEFDENNSKAASMKALKDKVNKLVEAEAMKEEVKRIIAAGEDLCGPLGKRLACFCVGCENLDAAVEDDTSVVANDSEIAIEKQSSNQVSQDSPEKKSLEHVPLPEKEVASIVASQDSDIRDPKQEIPEKKKIPRASLLEKFSASICASQDSGIQDVIKSLTNDLNCTSGSSPTKEDNAMQQETDNQTSKDETSEQQAADLQASQGEDGKPEEADQTTKLSMNQSDLKVAEEDGKTETDAVLDNETAEPPLQAQELEGSSGINSCQGTEKEEEDENAPEENAPEEVAPSKSEVSEMTVVGVYFSPSNENCDKIQPSLSGDWLKYLPQSDDRNDEGEATPSANANPSSDTHGREDPSEKATEEASRDNTDTENHSGSVNVSNKKTKSWKIPGLPRKRKVKNKKRGGWLSRKKENLAAISE